ncbi:hypothetical protein NPIL_308991 [Nephila pilipes]|uniref:Uncharacterized protein n=1 Tax=Nephila pilipes TaxID=299642 RepID=A0A8X6PF94_NEPPI|nr:hypothetical protein NPIL_308991 [Nephila pilipes]
MHSQCAYAISTWPYRAVSSRRRFRATTLYLPSPAVVCAAWLSTYASSRDIYTICHLTAGSLAHSVVRFSRRCARTVCGAGVAALTCDGVCVGGRHIPPLACNAWYAGVVYRRVASQRTCNADAHALCLYCCTNAACRDDNDAAGDVSTATSGGVTLRIAISALPAYRGVRRHNGSLAWCWLHAVVSLACAFRTSATTFAQQAPLP